MVNLGLAQELGGRTLEVVAKSLEERICVAMNGDSKYKLSDVASKEVEKKMMGFLGKDSYGDYQFGDLSRKIASLSESKKSTTTRKIDALSLSESTTAALADWDRRHLTELNSTKN